MPRIRPLCLGRGLVAVVALLLLVTGCSLGEPRTMGPAGVDGLEIPTPSPRPQDFVDEIDNPYLPLVAGSTWTYDVVGQISAGAATVSVSGLRTIAGVATTEVTTVVEAASGSTTSTAYYAQDDDGNVWSFGGAGWLAGVDGAQAGLVMPATPRVGDGFRQQYAEGVAEDTSMVLATTASASTAYAEWTDLIEVLETDAPQGPAEARAFYAPGVGLVLRESEGSRMELVEHVSGSGGS